MGLIRARWHLLLFLSIFGLSLIGSPSAEEGFWAARLAPLTLNSQEAADGLASEIIANFADKEPTDKKPVIEVLHLHGIALSPYLSGVLAQLEAAGFEVKGTFASAADFEKAETTLNDGYRLKYDSKSFQDKRSWMQRFFGLPQGMTVFAHFFKKKSWAWRFPFDKDIFTFARNTAGLAMVANTVMRYLAPWLTGTPYPDASEVITTGTFISLWTYFFLEFRREFASFKQQGKQIVLNPEAPPGEQIVIKPKQTFFNAAAVVQEHILSTVICGLLWAFNVTPVHSWQDLGWLALGGSLTAFASVYSYVSFDQVIAAKLTEVENLKTSNPQAAAALKKEISLYSNIFYNGLFPVALAAARFMGGNFKHIPLALLGVGGGIWKKKQGGQGKGTQFPETVPAKACAALIRIAQ